MGELKGLVGVCLFFKKRLAKFIGEKNRSGRLKGKPKGRCEFLGASTSFAFGLCQKKTC